MAPAVTAEAETTPIKRVVKIPILLLVTSRYPTAPRTIANTDAAGVLKNGDGRRPGDPFERSTPCNIE